MSTLAGLAVALHQDGRLEVVATAAQGEAGTVWHGQESDQGWSGFMPLGQPGGGISTLAAPALGRNGDGRLEAFLVGGDLAVWHAWQRRPGGDWTGWHSLGEPGGKPVISEPLGARPPGPTPALVADADARLQVFVVREDFTVWHRRQRAEGGWSEWASLRHPGDGTMGPPAVGANADGRLEVFVSDLEGAVWHAWQTPAGAGGWSGWHSLGGPGGHFAMLGSTVARNKDGRLELFTLADDGAVWHIWQERANNGWSGWRSLGSQGAGFAELDVAANADGALVVFATEQDNDTGLWQREQTTPGGGWSAWLSRADKLPLKDGQPAPGPIAEPTLILDAERKLELFLRVDGTGIAFRLANAAGPSGGPGWVGALLELPG